MRRRHLGLFFFSLLLLVKPAFGEELLYLANFSTNFLAVTQSDGGEAYSAQINWTPELRVPLGLSVRGELGVSLLKNVFGDKFLATHYQAFLGYDLFPPFYLEGGFGLESWVGNGGTHPLASLDAGLRLPHLVDRAFVGFSYFFLPGAAGKEFKVGVGFTF